MRSLVPRSYTFTNGDPKWNLEAVQLSLQVADRPILIDAITECILYSPKHENRLEEFVSDTLRQHAVDLAVIGEIMPLILGVCSDPKSRGDFVEALTKQLAQRVNEIKDIFTKSKVLDPQNRVVTHRDGYTDNTWDIVMGTDSDNAICTECKVNIKNFIPDWKPCERQDREKIKYMAHVAQVVPQAEALIVALNRNYYRQRERLDENGFSHIQIMYIGETRSSASGLILFS